MFQIETLIDKESESYNDLKGNKMVWFKGDDEKTHMVVEQPH